MIILIVVIVIGWRLDVLFAKDIATSKPFEQIVVDNSGRNEKPTDTVEESSDDKNGEELSEEEPVENSQKEPKEDPQQSKTPASPVVVKVEIPDGSTPAKIGLILEENGLVSSSREFIAKVVELRLDTKLKSGTYNIQKGLSIEDILILISN